MEHQKIFDNTEIAFQLKSDTELERAHFLFKKMSKAQIKNENNTMLIAEQNIKKRVCLHERNRRYWKTHEATD